MGTPDFSVPSLEALFKNELVDLLYVVSMPDRPSGRGHQLKSPEVIEFAREHKIPYFQTENINKENDFLESLRQANIDCIVVLAFAQFLGDKILKLPKLGCFNIHTSLLPKYRGAAPIQYAILNGDKITGVSIQRMVKKMDAGDICFSSEVQIGDEETGGELYNKLKVKAAEDLNEFVRLLTEDQVECSPQDESHVSFAPTLKKEDGLIDFKRKTVNEIVNQVRALDPWPGTYCMLNEKRLKVYKVQTVSTKLAPNELRSKDKMLEIGCLDGSLRLIEVQLEGKKRCSDSELLNGLRVDSLTINSQQ